MDLNVLLQSYGTASCRKTMVAWCRCRQSGTDQRGREERPCPEPQTNSQAPKHRGRIVI